MLRLESKYAAPFEVPSASDDDPIWRKSPLPMWAIPGSGTDARPWRGGQAKIGPRALLGPQCLCYKDVACVQRGPVNPCAAPVVPASRRSTATGRLHSCGPPDHHEQGEFGMRLSEPIVPTHVVAHQVEYTQLCPLTTALDPYRVRLLPPNHPFCFLNSRRRASSLYCFVSIFFHHIHLPLTSPAFTLFYPHPTTSYSS